jgi:hypothetical protein
MVILSGIITTSWTRNPPKEWLFRLELPANGQEVHLKNGYFARNYQLRDEETSGGLGFFRE